MSPIEKVPTADVEVENYGTIFLFRPLTEDAKDWIKTYVDPDAMHYGDALAVEHRFAENLAEGMRDAGLVLK